jgi:hypothetical protein
MHDGPWRKRGIAAAVGLVASVAASSAAPVGAPHRFFVLDQALIEKAALRHCWYRGGERRCRSSRAHRDYARRGVDRDYYVHDADKLPYGTARWWDQMLRENRAGNPGGGGRN